MIIPCASSCGTKRPFTSKRWRCRSFTLAPYMRSAHSNLGGTMRLGAQRAPVKAGTRAARRYGASVNERHRHRFEVNGRFVPQLEAHGMIISAATPKDQLPEMVELTETLHPWFIGVQFHP